MMKNKQEIQILYFVTLSIKLFSVMPEERSVCWQCDWDTMENCNTQQMTCANKQVTYMYDKTKLFKIISILFLLFIIDYEFD